ncbi:MAG: DNA repair protein RecO [Patescibacteria group bacterium]
MREYLTEALVLDKNEVNETDLVVDLYTKELGRVKAKVTSGQKITSKLSPHLEPLTFSLVRLTEKNGFVVVDALTQDYLKHFRVSPVYFAKALKLLSALKGLIYSEEIDPKLWFWLKKTLAKKEIFYNYFLKVLGYDPKLAECQKCRSRFIKYFLVEDQIFLCRDCGFKIKDFLQILEL